MIPVIYKGDDTDFNGGSPIILNIGTDFDLDGCRLELSFLGCRREFLGLSGRAAELSLVFSAQETGAMPLGTHRCTIRVWDPAGRVRTLSDSVRFKVTDSVDEAAGGSIDVEPGETVEELTEADGLGSVKEAVNKLARIVGAAATCLALTVGGATLNKLSGTNEVYTAAETDARIVELSPPAPPADYSTNNAELVATIEATAPAPGDYATVSNRAMSALQDHQSLAPATNYTDAATNALAASALSRSEAEAGCTAWRFSDESLMDGSHVAEVREGWSDEAQGVRYYDLYVDGQFESGYTGRIGETTIEFTWQGDGSVTATRTRLRPTADQEAYWSAKASHEDVTNVAEAVVREKSLGGIWDQELEVWWTPVMRGGALTYQATTNVNMNAEN